MNNRLLLLIFVCASAYVDPCRGVSTKDGLDVQIDAEGRITSMKSDGHEIAMGKDHSLLHLREVGKAWRAVSLNGPDIHATVADKGNFFEVDGNVIDSSGKDRCVDLKICLPIVSGDYKLGNQLGDGRPSRKGKRKRAEAVDIDVSEPSSDDSMYPIVSASGADVGLSLAVPPTHPTRFVTGMDAGGLFIILRIGLSKDSREPSHTPFRFIIYRHDPKWGLRSALARYYEFFRDPFFTRHVKRIGAWFSQNPSALRHPELYAYHEAGFATWHTPEGTESGINTKLTLEHRDEYSVCHSLGEFEKLCELELDRKLGIYALPYTIVGQRQIIQLPSLPKDYDDAMHVLETWTMDKPILFDGPPQAVSFRSAEELKTIIRNSSIADPKGHFTYLARPYRGATLTFAQNPDPKLDRDNDKETIAKYTLDYYLPMMFRSKYVDGCYTDSLGRWCSFYNYRREHWKYAGVPLTYAGNPARPCLWNLQSHAEYLMELGRRLHQEGKIFIANGVHSDRVMLGFDCDVMGGEGGSNYEAGESFYALRFAAGPKPYCLLNAAHHVSPKLWNSCLYMGYVMGCNTAAGEKDELKYLPMIIELNKAGWQPVTYARATEKEIGIERWGEGKAVYFSIMNRSTAPRVANIEVDFKSLGLEKHRVTDTFRRSNVEIEDGKIRFQLDAEASTVIKIEKVVTHRR